MQLASAQPSRAPVPAVRERADRYAFMPQMRDYDEHGQALLWTPFTMYTTPARFRSKAVTTDAFGFRPSSDGTGGMVSPEAPPAAPYLAVLGGSTAWGVGSTCDRRTVASILAQGTGVPCVDFAIRGHVLNQSLLAFMFYRPLEPAPRHVVVLAGVNEATLFLHSRFYPERLGPMFYLERYFDAMNEMFWDGEIPREAVGRIYHQVAIDPDRDREKVVDVLRLTLANLKAFCAGLGTRVSFFLQPDLAWVPGDASPEERSMLDYHRNGPEEGRASLAYLGRIAGWYPARLAQVCRELGIPFHDTNPALASHPGEWRFVDHCHLTDRGAEIVADLIRDRLAADTGGV